MLSIVLPTFNESRGGYLPRILQNLAKLSDAEVIVVDGGSVDDSLQLIEQSVVKLIQLPNSTRAARLNKGIEASNGEVILLHHPRSIVGSNALKRIYETCSGNNEAWGGLTHKFDAEHPLLKFTSWYSNRIRCDRRGIVYLDHCIFFNRALVVDGPLIPDVPIFEDTELSKLLRKKSRPVRLMEVAETSAIRFQQNGMLKQAVLNQLLKIAYYLKLPRTRMNNTYEKGLDLNN